MSLIAREEALCRVLDQVGAIAHLLGVAEEPIPPSVATQVGGLLSDLAKTGRDVLTD